MKENGNVLPQLKDKIAVAVGAVKLSAETAEASGGGKNRTDEIVDTTSAKVGKTASFSSDVRNVQNRLSGPVYFVRIG
ncbi:MAG: hypothetical protein II738_07670 [Clostridia bacterium]|nr:hypothetical protein [Clostridia bacterium]